MGCPTPDPLGQDVLGSAAWALMVELDERDLLNGVTLDELVEIRTGLRTVLEGYFR